jgi:hypothetical protein
LENGFWDIRRSSPIVEGKKQEYLTFTTSPTRMFDPVPLLTTFFEIPSGRVAVEDAENSLWWLVTTE